MVERSRTDVIEELRNKQEVYEVVARYCRGVDRLDLDVLRSCYHPDAVTHNGSFVGTVDEFMAWVPGTLARYTSTLHVIGNHLVELDGESGVSETYAIAYHFGDPDDDPTRNFISGLRYVDRVERRDGVWRISHRVGVVDWNTVARPETRFPVGPDIRVGARDRSDALYSM